MPEITGPGVGLLDYDGDGDLDIVAVRTPLPGRRDPAPNRLYRREADGRYTDVTESSGLGDPGFGQGVAIGDTDNDGDPDVYFTNYGTDAFYVNNGDGTFTEMTEAAGFSGERWSTSATFCDHDRDGDLDLYVAHYLNYDHTSDCVRPTSVEDYCGPQTFFGVQDHLYRNDGGRFENVAPEVGIQVEDGGRAAKGLGVICADLTGDGRADFFVANDGEPNLLWVNREDGRFAEQAMMRGVAVNRDGIPEANMGIAVGDTDRDGTLDLYVTHLKGENNALYCGGTGGLFVDRTVESRLGSFDLEFTGFGCGFFDLENDGDLDLAVANGRVHRGEALSMAAAGEFWNAFAEPHLLFVNEGGGVFDEASALWEHNVKRAEVGRALAFGDLDDDGDIDLVVSKADNGLRIYRNDAPRQQHHWLTVRPLTGIRDAIGATVTVVAGEQKWFGASLTGTSYLASNDPRVHFGLGGVDRIDRVEIGWPEGTRERFDVDGVDRLVTLRRGEGAPI
jgi:hypothetical protein